MMAIDPEKLAAALYLVAWAGCAWKLCRDEPRELEYVAMSIFFAAFFAAILMASAGGAMLIVAFVFGLV